RSTRAYKAQTEGRSRSIGRRETADAAPTFASGTAVYQDGSSGDAEAIVAALNVAQQGNSATLRMLGMCRLHLGQHEQALESLEAALELAPTDPYAQLHY